MLILDVFGATCTIFLVPYLFEVRWRLAAHCIVKLVLVFAGRVRYFGVGLLRRGLWRGNFDIQGAFLEYHLLAQFFFGYLRLDEVGKRGVVFLGGRGQNFLVCKFFQKATRNLGLACGLLERIARSFLLLQLLELCDALRMV